MPDGYLWLGTEFGQLRLDGVRSVPWEPQGGEACQKLTRVESQSRPGL
jgi:hypothetical protein